MPWFLIALIAVVAIVGLLALLPKPDIENARASKLGDFQFPRAQEGDPVPLIYGRVKLKSPNVLWYGDFEAVAITEKVKTGLFSSKRVTTGYRYYVGMALGLCIGPGVTVHRIWAGKDSMWTGTATGDGVDVSINEPGLFGGAKKGGGIVSNGRFYSGADTQTVDSYLASHTDGADTSMMPRMCWFSTGKAYVGTTASLKPWFFELSRYSNGLGLPGTTYRIGDDMNLVEVLFDVMTNKFARRGLGVSNIDTPSWLAAAATCFAEGNGGSFKIEASNTAGDIVAEILRQIDGIMYQNPSTGKIVLKLIREDYVAADLPVFTENEIEGITDFTKTLWEDTVNQVRVTFIDRAQDFTNRPVIEQDMANINFQQSVRSTEIKFPGIYDKDLAQTIARRELAGISVPIFKCEIKGNRKAQLLLPGEAFKLTWPDLGLNEAILRVQKYNLGTLTDGRLSFTAVQDKFASLTTQQGTPPSTGWTPVTDLPTDVGNAKVIKAPYWFAAQAGALDRTAAYLFALCERQPGPTIQYDANTTQGGVTTQAIGNSVFNEVGTLIDAMPATTATIGSLAITSVENAAGTASATEIKSGANLAWIGNELIAFVTGLTGSLTTVYRGILGTPVEAHSPGAAIHFLGDLDGLVIDPYQAGLQISTEFIAESATAAQAPGDGVTILYTPPVDLPGMAQARNLVTSDEVGDTVPNGARTISWDLHARLDTQILLPGDVFPTAPFGTASRVQILHDGIEVVNEILAEWGTTYDHTFPPATITATVRVWARTSGNEGPLAERVYTIT